MLSIATKTTTIVILGLAATVIANEAPIRYNQRGNGTVSPSFAPYDYSNGTNRIPGSNSTGYPRFSAYHNNGTNATASPSFATYRYSNGTNTTHGSNSTGYPRFSAYHNNGTNTTALPSQNTTAMPTEDIRIVFRSAHRAPQSHSSD